MLSAAVLLSGLASVAIAQFPPKPEGVTVLRSKFHENVTISFKEVCRPPPLSSHKFVSCDFDADGPR